jgi:hypothetical protein
MSQNHDHD